MHSLNILICLILLLSRESYRNYSHMDTIAFITLIEAVLILVAIAISKAIRLIPPLHAILQSSVYDGCKDVVNSIPPVSSASHIIGAPPPLATKYDVFLSFRGEDTRDTFSSYLYEALCGANIKTFMDHKLNKGDDISPILLKTIGESEISLIIFSKDYASSTWCMEELIHIMKCKDQWGRIVIPIFYNIDPSNVRKQNGSFGDGFAKLKLRFKHEPEKLKEWTNALIRSTNLSGWDIKNIKPESELIKMIVKDTLSKLNNKSSFHLEGLVGIAHQIKKIEELLDEARVVGIWGMGGIGKTTLAKAVFDRLNAQFEASSFVNNVREKLARIGLDELLERCLKDLLKDEDMNTYDFRSIFVKNRLQRKKILLVLDDVDNCIKIDDLITACGWFGEGSRIIITSRDMQVLKNTSASTTYFVQKLELPHALHLFSLKAFKHNEPSKSYLELSTQAVHYCKGNPLALKVLGCFLHGRGIDEWGSAMKNLSQTIHEDIFNVLKLSFDGLNNDTQKSVFLDLAFFLKEEWWISVDHTRRLYGSSTLIHICVLRDRSLISVDNYGHINMHALLIDMGLEISRQQLISNPEKPTRLWRHKDIYNLFNIDDKGIEAIQCMSIDSSKMMKSITLKRSHFWKMRNLIFFKVYKSDQRKPSNLNICEDLDYLPEELRFFSWEEYPLPYVPLHFCAKKLIALIMPNSNIRQLWNEKQHFPNLEEIDLSHSKELIALPDLSHVPKIKYVHLTGCVNLAQIHSSTLPEKSIQLWIGDEGPVQIKVGGSIKGKSSGLMIAYNYLDLENWSFNKVIMKVFVCGRTICGFRFKHIVVPLADGEELRSRILNLASLFPFVCRLEWLEGPIDFGGDFKPSHNHMINIPQHERNLSSSRSRIIFMNIYRGGRKEREEEDDDLMREEERYGKSCTLVDEVEEEDNDELIMEYCGGNIFTRLPNSITRWSLLTQLMLKESDIIGDADCKGIKPFLDVQLSLHDNPPSTPRDSITTSMAYHIDRNRQRTLQYLGSFFFKWSVNYGLIYSSNNHEFDDDLLSLKWTGC